MNDDVVSKKESKSLYMPASWTAKIDFINQLALSTNVMISVIGEKDGGKSSFAKLLQKHLDDQVQPCFITIDSSCDESALMKQMAEFLQMKDSKSLQGLLEAIQARGMQTLLIIDDAHLLPEGIVKNLFRFIESFSAKPCFLHICLIGNKTLLKSLRNLEQQNNEGMIHTIELGHLNEKETREYVLHRLLTQTDYVSLEKANQFYQFTNGSIDDMNAKMGAFFNLANSPKKESSKLRIIKKPLYSLSLVAAGAVFSIGLILTSIEPMNNDLSQSAQRIAEAKKGLENKPSFAQDEPSIFSSIPAYDLAAVKQFTELKTMSMPEVEWISEKDDDFDHISAVVLDKVVVAPKVIQVENSSPANKPKSLSRQAQKNQPNSKALAVAKNDLPVLSKKIDSSSYTIQLIASQSLAELERFAGSNDIQNKVYIFKSTHKNKDWYVLTMGEFSNREQAEKALERLPGHLFKFKPWIRKSATLEKLA